MSRGVEKPFGLRAWSQDRKIVRRARPEAGPRINQSQIPNCWSDLNRHRPYRRTAFVRNAFLKAHLLGRRSSQNASIPAWYQVTP